LKAAAEAAAASAPPSPDKLGLYVVEVVFLSRRLTVLLQGNSTNALEQTIHARTIGDQLQFVVGTSA